MIITAPAVASIILFQEWLAPPVSKKRQPVKPGTAKAASYSPQTEISMEPITMSTEPAILKNICFSRNRKPP